MTSLAEQNRRAWEAQTYEAWVKQYGTPTEFAAKIKANPAHRLRHVASHLGAVTGKKIANPLGSNGRMALALALAGAKVTVFDISEPNRRYALELAEAAGVRLEYIVGDFGTMNLATHMNTFDAVVIYHGVLHYFTDLSGFVARVAGLLKTDGRLVLHEFHPLLKKAVHIVEGKSAITGDYFASDVETVPVAFAPFTSAPDKLPTCLVRRWTLGEIVTAVAENGLIVERLIELPDSATSTLPGSFVLTAHRD